MMYVMSLTLIIHKLICNQKEYMGTHGTDCCNLDALGILHSPHNVIEALLFLAIWHSTLFVTNFEFTLIPYQYEWMLLDFLLTLYYLLIYLFHFQLFPCIMHSICMSYFNSSFAIIFIIESFIKLHLCFKHIQFDLSIFIGLSACGYCIASCLFLHYNKFTNKLYISYRIAWIS